MPVRLFLLGLVFTLTPAVSSAQTLGPYNESISIQNVTGAKLTYTVTVTDYSGTCNVEGAPVKYSGSSQVYVNFVYTDASGNVWPLGGGVTGNTGVNSGLYKWCPSLPPTSWPETTFYATPVFPYTSQPVISFYPDASFPGAGYAQVKVIAPGVIYPLYEVQSILYDTPGNKSNNGFQTTVTNGTVTTTGNSFTSGTTETFSVSLGFLFGGATLSWSYGNSKMTGNSTAVTSTISDATGVSNTSSGTGLNTMSHLGDMFIVWLNPAVVVAQTGANGVTYSLGTQLQTAGDPNPGQPEIQDQVEVFAGNMVANAEGVTTVPVNILAPPEPSSVDGENLPGLAIICAHPIYYPDSCTLANQCGCVPADFAPILAQDPLLSYTSTQNPLDADASGSTACACPTSADSCRYVPVYSAPNSCVQRTELLSGPGYAGGPSPGNTFMASDTDSTTQTLSGSDSRQVGFSWKQMWGTATDGVGLQSSTMWTWTDSQSTGQINGEVNSMTVTLNSATVGCYQHIPLFEDTEFHTFLFVQPAGDTSCLINGQ